MERETDEKRKWERKTDEQKYDGQKSLGIKLLTNCQMVGQKYAWADRKTYEQKEERT